MRSFDDLVRDAASADVTGWGFGWLDGRATEERPPWGYARQLANVFARVGSALDIDTGGGEVVAEVPRLPERMCVTETWPPNAQRARDSSGQEAWRSMRPATKVACPSRADRLSW